MFDIFYGNLVTIVFFVALYATYILVKRVYLMIQDYKQLCIRRERQKLFEKILLGVYGALGIYSLYHYGKSWWNRLKYKYSPINIIEKLNSELRFFPEINNIASKLETIINQSEKKNKRMHQPCCQPQYCQQKTSPPINFDSIIKMASSFIQPGKTSVSKDTKEKNKEDKEKEKKDTSIQVNPKVACGESIPIIPFDVL